VPTVTEFFLNYGMFLAKTVTIVLAIVVLVMFVALMAGRKRADIKDSLEVKKLNQKYDDMAMVMNANMLEKDGLKNT
jgi:serine protease SohB